jgi:transcription termination factor NusB
VLTAKNLSCHIPYASIVVGMQGRGSSSKKNIWKKNRKNLGMKKKEDPRHKKRQEVVQLLFAVGFQRNDAWKPDPRVADIVKHLVEVDAFIVQAAPEFPIDKINKTDLAILRLAVYELLIEKINPKKVIIDEAIELGKEFGGDTSPAFINGALGNIVTTHGKTD